MTTETKRGRGRPKTGKVLWAKRVSPEVAARLDGVLLGEGAPVGKPAEKPVVDVDKEEVKRLSGIILDQAAEIEDLKMARTRVEVDEDDTLGVEFSYDEKDQEIARLKGEVAELRGKVKTYETMLNGS